MKDNYQLRIKINDPTCSPQIEWIDLWTDISPDTLDVPAYILQYGFKYRYIVGRYRFVPPHQILSIFFDTDPISKEFVKGEEMLQI